MTVDARGRLENAPPFRNRGTRLRWTALLFNPAVELRAGLHIDAEKHLGVLRPAILCALAQIEPGLLRVKPHAVRVVGNQVGLPAQRRNPEAVIRICGEQTNEGWCRMSRV